MKRNRKPSWFPAPLHLSPPSSVSHWAKAIAIRLAIANAPQSDQWKAETYADIARNGADGDWPEPELREALGVWSQTPFETFAMAAHFDHPPNTKLKKIAQEHYRGNVNFAHSKKAKADPGVQPPRSSRWWNTFMYALPVMVDLSLDDETLKSHFDVWLRIARQTTADAGFKMHAKPIDEDELARWHTFQVLGAYDLMTWRRISGEQYSDAAIAEWLWPDGEQEEWVNRPDRLRKMTKPLIELVMDWPMVGRLHRLWAEELLIEKVASLNAE